MKWFAETTAYKDSVPNGIYLLDDSKTKMYAFKPRGTGEIKTFKNPIRIYVRWRKFFYSQIYKSILIQSHRTQFQLLLFLQWI